MVRDGEEPVAHRAAVAAEALDAPPRRQERVLDHVLGRLALADDAVGEREHRAVVAVVERPERAKVLSGDAAHEVVVGAIGHSRRVYVGDTGVDAMYRLRPVPERTYTTPLLDKLGVRPGARVSVLGLRDVTFLGLLQRRADVSRRPRAGSDLLFLAADSLPELARLRELEPLIRRDGAIWVVSRKGKAATLRDIDVIGAAKRAGLVDNKVASFSETHTALRLVVPRARR